LFSLFALCRQALLLREALWWQQEQNVDVPDDNNKADNNKDNNDDSNRRNINNASQNERCFRLFASNDTTVDEFCRELSLPLPSELMQDE
jgi:hypothetical protein